MAKRWLTWKFYLQVFFYTTLGIVAVAIPSYELGIGGDRLRWGAVMAGTLALITYLVWVYRAAVDLPGRSIQSGLRGDNRIAFTFDDGPNSHDTEAILAVLRRHNAKATFFCVGRNAALQPQLLRQMAAEGHAIGNHTQDHRKLAWLGAREIAHQIDAAQLAIQQAGVAAPLLFRAPHGVKSPMLPGILRSRGMKLCAWSQDIQDFQCPGTAVLVRRGWKALRDGEIVLMHDGGGERSQTAEALDQLLTECRTRGLTAVTVPDILAPARS